jgi:protease I
MGTELKDKRIAFLATDGVEQVELTEPWKALQQAGGTPELIAPKRGTIQGFDHHDKGNTFPVDKAVKDADPTEYDGLVLPGGVINPDILRTDKTAMGFVTAFFEQGKPVGAICHGPWSLVETGIVKGRKATYRGLFTSRKPDDLPAFCAKLVEEMGEGVHAEQHEAALEAVRS